MIIKANGGVGGIGLNLGDNSFYISDTPETVPRYDRTDNYLSSATNQALTAVGWQNYLNQMGDGVANVVPYARQGLTITNVSGSAQWKISTAQIIGVLYFFNGNHWFFEGHVHVRGYINSSGSINNSMGNVTIPWSNDTLTGKNVCSAAYVPTGVRLGLRSWAWAPAGFYACSMTNANQQVNYNCAMPTLPSESNGLEGWASPTPFYAQGTYTNYNIFQ